jgi:hypothetical protein
MARESHPAPPAHSADGSVQVRSSDGKSLIRRVTPQEAEKLISDRICFEVHKSGKLAYIRFSEYESSRVSAQTPSSASTQIQILAEASLTTGLAQGHPKDVTGSRGSHRFFHKNSERQNL